MNIFKKLFEKKISPEETEAKELHDQINSFYNYFDFSKGDKLLKSLEEITKQTNSNKIRGLLKNCRANRTILKMEKDEIEALSDISSLSNYEAGKSVWSRVYRSKKGWDASDYTTEAWFEIATNNPYLKKIIEALNDQEDLDILHDPIEDDPQTKAIINEVKERVEIELKDEPRRLGFCHKRWQRMKEILDTEYNIEWYSTAEMNPNAEFD